MAGKSNIEWTEQTWNPIVGCSIVSPGCTNCYAMKMAGRIEKMNRTGGSNSNYVNPYDGTTRRVNGNTIWTGKLARAPESTLLAPLRRKKPTTYFVNSMGDLFHEDCPDEWIDPVFAVMALCPQHTFQVLTKRAARMQSWVTDPDTGEGHINSYHRTLDIAERLIGGDRLANFVAPSWPLPNVWLGVSTERQHEADERIPMLLQTPAAVRFISAEPLLGPIDLTSIIYCAAGGGDPDYIVDATSGQTGWRDGETWEPSGVAKKLDWVIVGGESGHGHRSMDERWARDILAQCDAAGVAAFMKQMAGKKPIPADMMIREFPVVA